MHPFALKRLHIASVHAPTFHLSEPLVWVGAFRDFRKASALPALAFRTPGDTRSLYPSSPICRAGLSSRLMKILFGVIGAVLGFVAAVLLLELGGFGNRADPIMSGLIALFVVGPIGAIAGAVLGTKLAMSLSRDQDAAAAGGLAKNSLKALGVVVGLVAISGTLYYVYAVWTATPWLNPNAPTPVLQFEIRLAPGAVLPATKDIRFDLETNLNSMPGEVHPARFRRDGERAVIAGEVELAFRTPYRQLEVKIAGRPDRTYPIGLTAKAPHTPELGRWEAQPDGSEIRYRAKWH